MVKSGSKIAFVLLVASFIIAVGEFSAAQQWADKMVVGDSAHDFGVIARGAKAEHRFVLHNWYVEDVHIAGVRSSCGCTTVTIDKPTLKTHEEGAILAHINSDRFLGQKGATLTVTIDKPYYAEIRLNVKTYIRSDVVFQPGSVEVGTVLAGNPVERTVDLSYSGNSTWRVTGATCENPHIKCNFEETRRQNGQVGYRLHVAVDENAPAGYLNDQIILQTNDYQRSQVPLLVEGVIQAPLVVSPSPLRLGVVHHGEKVTKPIVIRGPKPFRILAITSRGSRLEFGEVDGESKTIHAVPVTFYANDGDSGKIDDSIQIITDLNTQENLSASVIIVPDEATGQVN